MIIRLVATIDSPPEGDRYHWLHCSHGKFPDFAGVYETRKDQKFIGALWEVNKKPSSFAVVVDCPEPICRGLMQTYLWTEYENRSYVCLYNRVTPRLQRVYDGDYEVLVRASIELAMHQGV